MKAPGLPQRERVLAMTTSTALIPDPAAADDVRDVYSTGCCIVGGGPGGVMLALLLARRGVPVLLLEAHQDFDREFRGDTLHPAILEILDEIGLAEPLHQLRHVKVYGPTFPTPDGPFTPFDFRHLKTRFPYIMLMHQPLFLEFLIEEARKYPHFRLVMGANVQRLVEDDGVVRGVRYRGAGGWHEVRAPLTVGADGRFSRLRHLAGFTPVQTSPVLDLLWFRLPRLPEDPRDSGGAFPRAGHGRVLVVLDRADHWQVGYLFPPGRYQELRAAGLEALRRSVAALEPSFARHVEHLTDWHQLAFLSVASSRCPRWYRPGLLLIGDAAHVMTPAAGAGIKYAVEDAVVAANVLAAPLKAGRVRPRDLAEVQRRREWPTRLIQAVGTFAVKRILLPLLDAGRTPRVPPPARLLFRIPFVRDAAARMVAFGLWRVHVEG
jgi:2-polyprenyl-6-methoxyphenol hydroxylase-like FAD-dependent oxidoreductase